jgi:hypothetical protein
MIDKSLLVSVFNQQWYTKYAHRIPTSGSGPWKISVLLRVGFKTADAKKLIQLQHEQEQAFSSSHITETQKQPPPPPLPIVNCLDGIITQVISQHLMQQACYMVAEERSHSSLLQLRLETAMSAVKYVRSTSSENAELRKKLLLSVRLSETLENIAAVYKSEINRLRESHDPNKKLKQSVLKMFFLENETNDDDDVEWV